MAFRWVRRVGSAVAVLFVVFLALALLYPCINRDRGSPFRDTEILTMGLDVAIRAYYREYGRFPPRAGPASGELVQDPDFALLSAAVRGARGETNTRGIAFLSVPRQHLDDAGRLIDSWKQAFHVVADWNGDGHVTVGATNLARPVAVWSSGPNRTDEQGAGDDISSWAP